MGRACNGTQQHQQVGIGADDRRSITIQHQRREFLSRALELGEAAATLFDHPTGSDAARDRHAGEDSHPVADEVEARPFTRGRERGDARIDRGHLGDREHVIGAIDDPGHGQRAGQPGKWDREGRHPPTCDE